MKRSPQADGVTGLPPWRDASRPRDERDSHRSTLENRTDREVSDVSDVELRVGRSSADIHHTLPLTLVGGERRTGADRRLLTTARTVVTEGVTTR